jgi:hypothetical protein
VKNEKPIEVPSLALVLQTMAFHVRCLATERPVRTDAPYCHRVQLGLALGSLAAECPAARVSVLIVPQRDPVEGDPWGVWAMVTLRDAQSGALIYQGNRAGAGDALALTYAPVVAWVADYWTKHASAARATRAA